MASEVLSNPDLCSVVFKTLEASGLCACSAVCHAWRDMARSDVLWKALADKGAEALALCPGATAEQRSATGRMLETLGGGSAAAGGHHRALLMRRKTKLPLTLCLDFGRGYAKYGFADSPKCAQLQICSPGAEACMASFISAALHKLRRAKSRSPGPTFTGGWPLAANSGAAAAIVAEPFRLAADEEEEERRRFHLAVRRDLARWRVPRCSPCPAFPPPERAGVARRPSSSAARDRPSPPLLSPRAGAAWSTPPPSCSSPTVSLPEP